MKPYPNEELDRMSKREIIRLYKRTVEQFNDAVPVIRCKDCKHRPYVDDDGVLDGDNVCPYLCDDPFYTVMPRDDWFCHRGERKDNEI